MKVSWKYTVFFILTFIFLFVSCKSQLSLADQERLINAVESRNYVIIPSMAMPMNWRTVNLTSTYYVKVFPDSLSVYLPYYGRSYQAPMDPRDIGYDFLSTEYEYAVEKKKDSWEVEISPRDYKRNVTLYISIGNSGYASIRVQDSDRQGISYSGTVEPTPSINN